MGLIPERLLMMMMMMWHLDALCYEGCEGHGTANGLSYRSLEWNWPKEAMNRPIGAGIVDGAKLFQLFSYKVG